MGSPGMGRAVHHGKRTSACSQVGPVQKDKLKAMLSVPLHEVLVLFLACSRPEVKFKDAKGSNRKALQSHPESPGSTSNEGPTGRARPLEGHSHSRDTSTHGARPLAGRLSLSI